mgnify:CR=1 FL=1
MVNTAKVTSRGQMTIPQPVREALGIREGDEVYVYVADKTRAIIEVRPRRKLTDLYGAMQTPGTIPNPEEIRDTAKRYVAERFLEESKEDLKDARSERPANSKSVD